jgi:hypothetical protein
LEALLDAVLEIAVGVEWHCRRDFDCCRNKFAAVGVAAVVVDDAAVAVAVDAAVAVAVDTAVGGATRTMPDCYCCHRRHHRFAVRSKTSCNLFLNWTDYQGIKNPDYTIYRERVL